jgi:GNAT superfamily N-acetyltransferase
MWFFFAWQVQVSLTGRTVQYIGFTYMTIHIEKAEIEDLQRILELQKLAYRKEAERYDDFTIPPLTQTIEEITSEFESTVFLKLCHGNEIAGSIRGKKEGSTCHVGRLMVHPEHRGKGFGSMLIRELENCFLEDEDVRRFELFTGDQSHDNIQLYESRGYRIYKTESPGGVITMVYMEKIVRPGA